MQHCGWLWQQTREPAKYESALLGAAGAWTRARSQSKPRRALSREEFQAELRCAKPTERSTRPPEAARPARVAGTAGGRSAVGRAHARRPLHPFVPSILRGWLRAPVSRPPPAAASRPGGLGSMQLLNVNTVLCLLLLLAYLSAAADSAAAQHMITKRNYSDQSVKGYLAERTCWWNEVCKEEFHSKFRCRCPRWAYCRAPGRYYDAVCSMTKTGYIWTQPETPVALDSDK